MMLLEMPEISRRLPPLWETERKLVGLDSELHALPGKYELTFRSTVNVRVNCAREDWKIVTAFTG